MLRFHTKEIEGRDGVAEYSVKEFGFDAGLKLQARLLKLVSPALDAFSGEGLELGGSVEKLALLVLEDVDSGLIGVLCKNLTRTAEEEGKKNTRKMVHTYERDAAWGGNYLEALKAIKFVLEVNFGPFFRDVGSQLLGQLSTLTEPDPTSSEKTESTESAPAKAEGLLSKLLFGSSPAPSGEGGNSTS